MEDDLRALGLEPERFLGTGLGKGGAREVLGNRASRGMGGGVADEERREVDRKGTNQKIENVAEDVARDGSLEGMDEESTSNVLLRGSNARKDNNPSAIAPTEEDVHPDSEDHVAAAIATQHASDQHVLGKRKRETEHGGLEHADVTGVREGRGKKRVPPTKEGGAAGGDGVPSEPSTDRIPKRRKDAYEIRMSPFLHPRPPRSPTA